MKITCGSSLLDCSCAERKNILGINFINHGYTLKYLQIFKKYPVGYYYENILYKHNSFLKTLFFVFEVFL